VHSAAVAGLGIGAVLCGPLGDKYGRRRIILLSFALIIVAVSCSGLTASVPSLMFWRLLTGIGLGAMLANAGALLAEFVPAKRRSLLLTLSGSGITVGAMSSGLLVPYLLEQYHWQAAFWASAAVSLLIWLVLLVWLPEAPSHRQRNIAASAPGAAARPGFFTVLLPEHRYATLALWTLFIGNAFLIYILVSWMPVLMTQRGWDLARASSVIVYFQGGGLCGGLLVAALMDRWNPFYALLTAYLLTALCLLGFTLIPDDYLVWSVLFASLGAGISGVHMTINAMAAVVYPLTILSSAIGFTVAVARIGAIGAPIVGGLLIARQVALEQFMLLLLVPVGLCALSVTALARQHRRKGRAV
jgi:AAHS family 4-hydroxybenzoate transporter-like MFS transporter